MDDKKYKHPSYGLVSFSRRSGNPGRLFGSKIGTHNSYVTLAIKTCEYIIDRNGEDHFYAPIRGDIVEVDISAAQFAELITTMNTGLGVPCTISVKDGKKIEEPPSIDPEHERIRGKHKKLIDDLTAEAAKLAQDARVVLRQKTLNKADREGLLETIDRIVSGVRSNAPFMLEIFEEAAERVTKAAKAEVDAIITNNVIARGIKSLISDQVLQPPQLPEKSEPNSE